MMSFYKTRRRLLRLASSNGSSLRQGYGRQAQRQKSSLFFLPLIFFIFVAVIWFFPVLQHFTTSAAGVGGDPYQTLWRFNRLGETLKQGSIFVPEEKTLPNLAPLPWLPVYYLFGDIVAYNTAWLASVILAGLLCYVLARQWGAEFWPALISGLLVEIAPYRIAQSLGHFGAMQFWVIFAVLICFTTWYRKNNFWAFLLGMLFSIWTAWTDHQLFVILLMVLVVFWVAYWREVVSPLRLLATEGQALRSQRRRTFLMIMYAVLIVAMLIIAVFPFAGSIFYASQANGHLNLGDSQRENYSATWRSLILPVPFSVLGGRVYDTNISADNIQTLGLFLPIGGLAIFIVSKKKKQDIALMVLVLGGLVLSLGATMKIHGINIPLPGQLFYQLPILSAIRTAGRFAVLPVMFLPVYFAIKWEEKRKFFWTVLWLLCLIEILPVVGFPVMEIDHTKAKQVAENLGSGAVLAIPAYTNYQYGSEQLYYSLDYKKPVAGNSALLRIVEPKSLEEFLATPVIRDLVLLRLADFNLPTIFGQTNKEIVNLAFASQGINSILLETSPRGGVISLEGNKRVILDGAKIALVRTYLRDTLGLKESKAVGSAFVYTLPGDKRNNNASYFAMEGRGWQIKKKLSDRSVVELQPLSDFYLYSSEDKNMILKMSVLDSGGNAGILVQHGNESQASRVLPNNQIIINLKARANTLIKYTITFDGKPILVENPRIQ